ncbi:MAG: CapA family protein [Clostridia bacterium]|nr:CapA family protein [Clostridia bacterium]
MFLKKKLIILFLCFFIISFVLSSIPAIVVSADTDIQLTNTLGGSIPQEDVWSTITISAAGDVTLGRDAITAYYGSFDHEVELQKSNYSYFMKNVKHLFETDDLTIVNLEGPLTKATIAAEKQFRFKGSAVYTEVLKQGSIEAVNLANNHMFDYQDQGYWDTVSNLSGANLGYFGFEHKYLTEVKGIKIGMLGLLGWDSSKQKKEEIKKAVESLKEQGAGANLIIASFHWGEERKYTPNKIQKDLGRYCIDIGVDLVLGHHPHVVQGIETYKGKSIVYSMGNFCFGGNKNPTDKDAYIYQHSFNFKNNVLQQEEGQVIPVSISSVKTRNNYQPTPLKGIEADRVMNKIKNCSLGLNQ